MEYFIIIHVYSLSVGLFFFSFSPEVFVVDAFTSVTKTVETFVSQIQASLTVGTLNFEDALCKSADKLVSDFKDVSSNQLLSAVGSKSADLIVEQLKEVCEDTAITDDDVKEGRQYILT